MKFLSFISLIALLLTGCASPRPVASAGFNKREEIEVLQAEVDVVTREWLRLQSDLEHNGNYPAHIQQNDLNYVRSILLNARDKISNENRRLHLEYKVDYGPL